MMNVSKRGRVMLAGAAWWFVLALIPALAAFQDPFSVSPFLISSFVVTLVVGGYGALVAGRRAAEGVSAVRVGLVHAGVVAPLAAVGIWLLMSVNMSGFNLVASPAAVLNLFMRPSIFLEAGIVGVAVFVYAALVGAILAPLSGLVISRMVRGGGSV